MIDDFRKMSKCRYFESDCIFWFFVLPFFRKTREIRQKKSGTKRHFYLIGDNFLKQKALDRFTFAWGTTKGFFFFLKKSIKTNKCNTWTSEQQKEHLQHPNCG